MAYLQPTVRQLQPLGRRNPHLEPARRRVENNSRKKPEPHAPHPAGGARHLR